MNKILTEKEYQEFILEYLNKTNGFVIRTDKNYDRLTGMDKELFFKFLEDTQPKEMADLRKIYNDSLEETIINYPFGKGKNGKKRVRQSRFLVKRDEKSRFLWSPYRVCGCLVYTSRCV